MISVRTAPQTVFSSPAKRSGAGEGDRLKGGGGGLFAAACPLMRQQEPLPPNYVWSPFPVPLCFTGKEIGR